MLLALIQKGREEVISTSINVKIYIVLNKLVLRQKHQEEREEVSIYMYYSSLYNYCIGAIKQVSSETETLRGKRGSKYLHVLLFLLQLLYRCY